MSASDKFDIKKIYPNLYQAFTKKPQVIDVPVLRILAIKGSGDPQSAAFTDSVDALYSTLYTIKYFPKKNIEVDSFVDFAIPPLEGLWSMQGDGTFDPGNKSEWIWELFLVVPGFVTPALVDQAIAVSRDKKSNPRYDNLHISTLEEKTAVQVMHHGPYDKEQADIDLLHQYAISKGYRLSARHHEIYLNDSRRVNSPASLWTILRQPVVKMID